jgi:hypothetical protein
MRKLRFYIEDMNGNVLWEVIRKRATNPHRTKEYQHMVFLLNRAPSAPMKYGYEYITQS